jgi:murein L,D-transpeptidase YcbB/YkuD
MPSRSRLLILALLTCVLLLPAPARAQAAADPARVIEYLLAEVSQPYVTPYDRPGFIDTLRTLYRRRGYAPLWLRSGVPTAQAERLAEVLRDAGAYGLHPSDYNLEVIEPGMRTRPDSAESQAALDLALSRAALRFVSHLHYGRVDPRKAGFQLKEPRTPLDLGALLDELAGSTDIAATMASVEPDFLHYRLLKDALTRYRELATDTSLAIPPRFKGRSVRPGERYEGASALRHWLAAVGDLPEVSAPPAGDEVLDDALVAGLRRFQERHGIEADGVLGKRTYAALAVPLTQRLRQIEITLERWRWLPEFKTPPIIVNLPQFRLFAFRSTNDRAADILQMDVIVGQAFPRTRTPIFVAQMKYVVFRPYWDVPMSILERELLPDIRANPAYLDRNHMEIVNGDGDDSPVVAPTPANIAALGAGRFRLRQLPGEDNALGAIKFVFPNPYNVYLHSTPAQHLFQKSRRAFSHGCIRVSDPVALAEHVLRNAEGQWSREAIEEAMNGEPNRRVDLETPIQVMILYATVLATETGRVYFFDDLYGHDGRLERLLRVQNE